MALTLTTKALYKNSHLYIGYSSAQDFSIHEYIYTVRISHVLNTPQFHGDSYGLWQISLLADPNNQRCNLGSYKEITTCKFYNYGDLKYSRQLITMSMVFIHWDPHRPKGLNLRDSNQNTTL